MQAIEGCIRDLQQRVLQILSEHPDGLSEHELLRRLEQTGRGKRRDVADQLALFRAHFLLFHVLYRLRDELHASGRHGLHIDCLDIRLMPYVSGNTELPAANDPLRDYYLELDHLYRTGEQEVEELLSGFWQRYVAQDRRAWALSVLGLQDPVENDEIKRRFRELAMRHHPDRGGEQERIQDINAAMAVLDRMR